MRISKGRRGWLAVVALGLGTVKGDVTFNTFSFNGDFDPNRAIFDINRVYDRLFTWIASPDIMVDEIILFANYTVPIGLGKFMGSTPASGIIPTPTPKGQDSELPRGLFGRQGINVGGPGTQNVTLKGRLGSALFLFPWIALRY
jgi:hypothetical protein